MIYCVMKGRSDERSFLMGFVNVFCIKKNEYAYIVHKNSFIIYKKPFDIINIQVYNKFYHKK